MRPATCSPTRWPFCPQALPLLGVEGDARTGDVLTDEPGPPVEVVLLLKSIPCLEQIDRSAGERLVAGAPARYVVVSFPTASLGGRRDRGMLATYRRRMEDICRERPWSVREYLYDSELAYLVDKSAGDTERGVNMTMPPVRLAIAGAGHMGARHATCIRANPEAQLVAVWSRTHEHASALARSADAQAVASIEDLVQRADVDAVIVATPTANHAETALAAIRAGKHVLVEKPLARSMPEAEMLVRAAEDAGVLLLTGHVLRFYPVFRSLHEHILAGEIGTPAVIHMSRETSAVPTGWRASLAEGGGVILDLGIHEFDWLLWTLGPVQRVYCRAVCRSSASAHDYALSTLRFASGAIAQIESSAVRASGFRIAGEFAGDRGMLTYDSDLDQALRAGSRARRARYLGRLAHNVYGSQSLQPPTRALGALHPRTRAAGRTPEQALGALQVALAALESAQTGKAVTL